MQIALSPIALHTIVALKSQYVFVVDTKPSPANKKIKYEFLHCASQIFHKFPVVYTLQVTDDEFFFFLRT